MDDLIGEGSDEEDFERIIAELVSVFMVENEREGDHPGVRVSCPALVDVIWDSCTPLQIETISCVLLERLEPSMGCCYKVPLLCAHLANVKQDKDIRARLWRCSHDQLQRSYSKHPEAVRQRHLQLLEDEILDAGQDPVDILGQDWNLVRPNKCQLHHSILFIKNYKAPVAYGPMGHSLNVICRNVYQEITKFNGRPTEGVLRLEKDSLSAYTRFCTELKSVEELLTEHGLGMPSDQIDTELRLVHSLIVPSVCQEDVYKKALTVTDNLVANYTNGRLERLHRLGNKFLRDTNGTTNKYHSKSTNTATNPLLLMNRAPDAIRLAFMAMQNYHCKNEAAQHALATLANQNWMPTALPEDLPAFYYHTVATIRTATLRKLTPGEPRLFKHQQSVDDLVVFLITTALLAPSRRFQSAELHKLPQFSINSSATPRFKVRCSITVLQRPLGFRANQNRATVWTEKELND